MKKSYLAITMAVLMTVSSMAGCAPKSSSTPASAAPATASEGSKDSTSGGDTIKIGYVSALSGDTALWGQAGLNGMNLTLKDINANGGVLGKQIEIIGLDGKGEAADSVSAYKKLVDEYGVCAVVGTNFSSCNIPIAAVADELKVPVIATAASNELVTVDENGNLHPYSFRLCFIDSYQGTVAGKYAFEKLGFKKAAIITDISDAYSSGVGKYMKESFVAAGGEIVAEETAQSSDNDFRAQLTKIAKAQPDVLFVPWIYQKVGLISKQAKEVGITCALFGADGWDSNELVDLSGNTLDGSYYVSRIGFNSPDAAAYGEKYVNEYKIDLEAECLYGNDGLLWIVDAIQRAGSADPVAVRDALEATDTFTGLLGTMKMDAATHNPLREVAVFRCDSGEFKYVETYK